MKDIAIYGTGGLGREVAALINKINKSGEDSWNLIGFFDDGKEKGDLVSHFGQVLGGLQEVNEYPLPLNIILAFGNPRTTKHIYKRIYNKHISFPNIISPNFEISDKETFTLGIGNIIKDGCFVSTDVHIDNFNLLNGSNVFGHDTNIGSFNVFMPATRISGDVRIGEMCLFGTMSFVHQRLNIPDKVTLGPLSALLTNPRPESTYIGNPAKKFRY